MQARKIIEIAIYPKIFSVLSFYSKGQYAVSISVKQELLDGTVLPSYPTILRRTEINIHESKKPQVKIENQEAAFITEQYSLTKADFTSRITRKLLS